MNGEAILIDSNVIIHFVAGSVPEQEAQYLLTRSFHISFITEIEIRSFLKLEGFREKASVEFLPQCMIHGISEVIKDEAVRLRRTYKLKTPDAIIAATAIVKRLSFMTGDKGLRRLEKEVDRLFIKYP